jgi:hypothetical protein
MAQTRSHIVAGFTLFEVAISLLVFAIAVLSVVLAYPIGLKAQRMARFQLFAGTKVLEIMDAWGQGQKNVFNRQTEGWQPGQTMFMGYPLDLERMLNEGAVGLFPLPPEIAGRLDSDNDEIGSIIAQGGQLLYPTPIQYELGYDERQIDFNTAMGLNDPAAVYANGQSNYGFDKQLASQAQTLVFAVTGYAQQNALPNHPCLEWPYYEHYPCPAQPWECERWGVPVSPSTTTTLPTKRWSGGTAVREAWPATAQYADLYAQVGEDPNSSPTYARISSPAWVPYVVGTPKTGLDANQVDLCIGKAIILAESVGVAMEAGAGGRSKPKLPRPYPAQSGDAASLRGDWRSGNSDPFNAVDDDYFPKPWKVEAIRLLAHVASLRTNTKYSPSDDQRTYAKQCHDACLAWAMRYASANPYEWGAPRPLNRQTAWDYPLLQYDLFAPYTVKLWNGVGQPLPLPIAGDAAWKVCCGLPPQQYPVNYRRARGNYGKYVQCPDNQANLDESWADNAHYNLTAPFAAAERCRQIVVWTVDWRAYEDFETVPAAPMDAIRGFIDSTGRGVNTPDSCLPPECNYLWKDINRTGYYRWPYLEWTNSEGVSISDPRFVSAFLGTWGCDRNGNGVCDSGPIPKSVRMRAVTVARFNFYDRRIPHSLRH